MDGGREMSELVPKPENPDGVPTQPPRKPWRTPRFIVSEVIDTQFGSDPPTSDSPYSQLS